MTPLPSRAGERARRTVFCVVGSLGLKNSGVAEAAIPGMNNILSAGLCVPQERNKISTSRADRSFISTR